MVTLAEKLTLNADECAALLGVSRSTVWEAIWRGQLRSVKIGRRVLIPRQALQEFLGNQELNSPREGA